MRKKEKNFLSITEKSVIKKKNQICYNVKKHEKKEKNDELQLY